MGITQLNFDGDDKVQVAIQRLRQHEPPEGYFVAFSGGKDSQVIHQLSVEAGVAFDAHYSVSPIDPPEIRQFIKGHYPEVAWDIRAKGFWTTASKKGLPWRNRRWCCSMIKETGGNNRTIVLGIRWEESPGRRKHYKEFYDKAPSSRLNAYRLMPILDWSERDVWEFIESRQLSYCTLYDDGFARIGCIMCPLAGRPQMRRDAARWPTVEFLWWHACQRYWERYGHKDRYPTAAAMWRWWIGKDPPDINVPKCLEVLR